LQQQSQPGKGPTSCVLSMHWVRIVETQAFTPFSGLVRLKSFCQYSRVLQIHAIQAIQAIQASQGQQLRRHMEGG
jgi:hypothetical protein